MSLLIIAVDTLRADRVGPRRAADFPNLARLWSQSIRFRHALTAAPETRLAVGAVLQGRSSPSTSHSPELLTHMARSGHRIGVVAPGAVIDRLGSHTDLSAVPTVAVGPREPRPLNDAVVDTALSWLDASRRPFTLWVHLFASHEWRRWSGATPHARYDRAVAVDDRAVGRLLAGLDARGVSERTVVVLVSDHGEGLGDHGWLTHTVHVHREIVHVPLAMRIPGEPGRDVDAVVGLVSLPATVAALFGTPPPTSREGASLLPLVGRRERVLAAPRPVITRGAGRALAVRGEHFLRFDEVLRAPLLGRLDRFFDGEPPNLVDDHERRALELFRLLYR